MKYRAFIEHYFLIDEPTTGKLVPFKFNEVQAKYYQDLIKDYDIENKGISAPVRDFIVKARREGFSSLILGLFAADDITQSNPTESQVISYRDDGTSIFRKRYRRFILSWFARKPVQEGGGGIAVEDIQNDANILEKFSKQSFSVDASDLELRHNRAHFYCGTASARTGGRGSVLQKLLYSEAAHYQDSEKITAKEIIEGTAQQVDKSSGWIFQESTGNGKGNYFYQTYEAIKQGLSRYKLRFYGWRSFYSEAQFKVIASEFTDMDMLKQEYPETEEEAFLASSLAYTTREQLVALVDANAGKTLEIHLEMSGVNYMDQGDSIKDFAITFAKTHPNHRIYLGLDTAKNKDRTTLTVLMEKDLNANGGIKGIAVDSTGQGDFMPDWFERNTDWHILRIKFSRPTKSIMWKNLQVVIQDKLTALPKFWDGKSFISEEWQHFYKQMMSLQKEIIGSMLVVEHPSGTCSAAHNYDNCVYHDDYPDSWALAELLYTSLNGVPAGQRPPEETGNFDTAVRRLLNRKGPRKTSGEDFM